MSGTPVMVLRFAIDEQPFALPICDDSTLGLTPREHMRITTICGIRGIVNLTSAIEAFDVAALTALAIVAAERAGAKLDVDAILDGKSALSFDADDAAGPPPVVEAEASVSVSTSTLEAIGSPS